MGRPPKFGTHRISCLIFIASLFSAGIMPGCLHVPELPKVSDDLRTAKIDRGKADFAKVIFDRYPELRQITDLRYGRFGNDMESELAVVGTAGAAFLGPDRRIKKTVRFAPRMFNPVVLIQPRDGVAPVFLGRGGSWGDKVRVFDANGALLWEYGSFWGINGSAGGDIKADGRIGICRRAERLGWSPLA